MEVTLYSYQISLVLFAYCQMCTGNTFLMCNYDVLHFVLRQ